jgi:hypothetical protein
MSIHHRVGSGYGDALGHAGDFGVGRVAGYRGKLPSRRGVITEGSGDR